MKATAVAPSNIAFIKYWGRKDEVLRLPENGSLSMNLSGLQTTTTVEFSPQFTEDYIEINGIREPNEGSRAIKHLDRVRALAKIADKAKVVTKNNFPIGTGLSSSASGFAALTVASAKAAGLNLSEKELSILARQGSGSACRSIPDGFVEWLDGDTSDASYAVSLYPPDYWDLIDVVAVVSEGRKDVPSSEGQKLVSTSPFFPVRKAHIQEKLALCKKILAEKNFTNLGELMEAEALEMHAVMLTSKPSLIYWTPGTLTIMKLTKKWRAEGISVYFTINTGQDIHLICESKTQLQPKAHI
ncbi:MAG: Diphosphomevalonate decarboxylase [Candidatus Gottesmanbacteria bacterium GW2011_GWA1_42_26]|nr:MAG: Diphosphomevalonate decarboxylase [Candidatus Gottesmanbacteria bacterium GW2011_GWA1_42_26]